MDIDAFLNEKINRALAILASAYIRKAPWNAGKRRAFQLFHEQYGWRGRTLVTQTAFGDSMEVQFPDLVSRVIYATGVWEPLITKQVRQRLQPGDTFIDVGANIGYYTLLASRLVGDTGRVVAIEANARIAARLRRNVALNKCCNVTVIQAAASDSKQELCMYDGHADNLGHSTTIESIARREAMRQSSVVQADTLENLVGTDVLHGARLIKVDVEGAERAVLGALFGKLKSLSAQWLLELTPSHCPGGQGDVSEIFGAFVEGGYRAHLIENSYKPEFLFGIRQFDPIPLSQAPSKQADVLFVKE